MIKIDDVNDIKLELGDRLCDYDEGYLCDIITEITDNNVDIYNYDLLEWLKHHWELVDDAVNMFGFPSANDSSIIIKLAQQAQYVHYEQVLYDELDDSLLNYCLNYIERYLNIEEMTEEQWEEIQDKCTNVDNNDQLEEFNGFLDDLFKTEDEE